MLYNCAAASMHCNVHRPQCTMCTTFEGKEIQSRGSAVSEDGRASESWPPCLGGGGDVVVLGRDQGAQVQEAKRPEQDANLW